MSKILLRKFAFIVLLISMSATSVASEPMGMCPDESPSLVNIVDMLESGSPSYAGIAHGLLQQDVNGDGYACALFKCTLCPPNAHHCVLICNYRGPFSDNDQ